MRCGEERGVVRVERRGSSTWLRGLHAALGRQGNGVVAQTFDVIAGKPIEPVVADRDCTAHGSCCFRSKTRFRESNICVRTLPVQRRAQCNICDSALMRYALLGHFADADSPSAVTDQHYRIRLCINDVDHVVTPHLQ